MSDRPVRWGILATGPMAAAFTEDLALIPEAEVVAVSSRSEHSARLFADRFSTPRSYGSWQALAADPEVDVVYVATPHAHHLAATTVCLDGGKGGAVREAVRPEPGAGRVDGRAGGASLPLPHGSHVDLPQPSGPARPLHGRRGPHR